jgi:thiol:disulfide interchange protein DsbD
LTCQTNKKFVLETDAVRKRLAGLKVIPLRADFTRRDPLIQQELRRHHRAGVPLNIVVPAGRPADVIVLPELLTRDLLLDALEKAGKSRPEAVRQSPGGE